MPEGRVTRFAARVAPMHIIETIIDVAVFVADVTGLVDMFRWFGRKWRGERD